MFKLLKRIILKRELITQLVLAVLFIAEDMVVYQQPYLTIMFIGIMPLSMALYCYYPAAAAFTATSPYYNEFMRKKFPLYMILLTVIPYLLLKALYIFLHHVFTFSGDVEVDVLLFSAACMAIFTILSALLNKTRHAATVLMFVMIFLTCIAMGSLKDYIGSTHSGIVSMMFSHSFITGLLLVIFGDIAGIIIYRVFYKMPVTTENFYVNRYMKRLIMIK